MKNFMEKTMNDYWDKEYPTHIEIPEGYFVSSHDVEYVEG